MASAGNRSKRTNGNWSEHQLKLAVKAVMVDGKPKKTAAKMYDVPRPTLQRYLKRIGDGDGGIEKRKNGRPLTLSDGQELELVTILKTMADRLYGLSPTVVRELVYKFCVENAIENRFNEENQKAGWDWFKGFLQRHPTLSVRVAEATSMQRAIGFNKPKVKLFFDKLKKLMFDDEGKQIIPAANIFNVDETGYTVCQKPGKVVAARGKRSVGGITSAEKGRTITAVCCCSADGVFVPPLLIYPRVRVKPEFMDNAPVGAIAAGSKNGWITVELFEKWFDHFLNAVHPEARNEKVLLILDGHSSHTRNINVVDKARAMNVEMLSLPSHSTHKIQPLDITFFKSANAFYDKCANAWLRAHPGRVITELEVGALFREAYGKAATVQNATSGFVKSGICPFNDEIFTDEDFVVAEMTERPDPGAIADVAAAESDAVCCL